MNGRSRTLLALLLALLMAFAQQAGIRHYVGHIGDAPGMRDAGNRRINTASAPGDSGERAKACPDCLALLTLDGLPGNPLTAPYLAAAACDCLEAPDRSIPNPPPTARGQGPPVRS